MIILGLAERPMELLRSVQHVRIQRLLETIRVAPSGIGAEAPSLARDVHYLAVRKQNPYVDVSPRWQSMPDRDVRNRPPPSQDCGHLLLESRANCVTNRATGRLRQARQQFGM